MPLVQNSLTHPPTPLIHPTPTHHHTPNDYHSNLINILTHSPPPSASLPHLHTQNDYLENLLVFSKTHSVQFALSMYLNRHRVSFGKVTGFHGIHSINQSILDFPPLDSGALQIAYFQMMNNTVQHKFTTQYQGFTLQAEY